MERSDDLSASRPAYGPDAYENDGVVVGTPRCRPTFQVPDRFFTQFNRVRPTGPLLTR